MQVAKEIIAIFTVAKAGSQRLQVPDIILEGS